MTAANTPDMVAHHLPALKVGGRRLSTSNKPRPHLPSEPEARSPSPDEPTDYPRPAPPSEHSSNDDDASRKEHKKGDWGEVHGRKPQTSTHKMHEPNMPTREELPSMRTNVGGAGRIGQPAGKEFAI